MPFYNFKCIDCNNIQEELVKTSVKESVCNECGGKAEKQSVYFTSSIGLPNGHISFRDKNSRRVQKERTDKK